MYIQRILPKMGFGVVDRNVLSDKDLSEGARLLYAILISIPPGANYKDEALASMLGIKPRALIRRRNELKVKDLIFIDRISPKVYQAYIGHSKLLASEVKKILSKEDILE